ncbi:MAG: hypothetical protein RPT25_15620, partial [Cycloclasticus sp.]
RFPLQEHVIKQIIDLKERQKLRLHGLVLGQWKSRSMQAVCDPLHVFESWNSLAEEFKIKKT